MEKNFSDLGVTPPILKAIAEMGFETPTEVQSRVIPHVLENEDLIVMSKTGSGKTAVFGIPLLQMTDPYASVPEALILTPTRELAVQIDTDLKQMSAYLPHTTTAVYGQHSMNLEVQALKKGASIVTGTPGRVYDHIRQANLKVKQIRYLVLDEADRMLDMGFIDQVFKIIKTLPKDRVTLLFSATIPPEIQSICKGYMKNPVRIEIESPTKTVDTIRQTYFRMSRDEKRTQLHRLLMIERPESCLIFCNTRRAVDQVQRFLTAKGYASKALHGDIPQAKRLSIMNQFKNGDLPVLVATDVAARGIHVDDLALVINYDVPNERDNYIHRIGRTGRAGKGGRAITFVTGDDIISLYEIEEHTGAMIEEANLPTDLEVNAQKSEAERWIKEKYQSSVSSSAPVSKEPRGSRENSLSKPGAKRRRRRPRSGEGPTDAAAAGSVPAPERVPEKPRQEAQGRTRTEASSRPRKDNQGRTRTEASPGHHADAPAKTRTDAQAKSRTGAQAKSRTGAQAGPRPEARREMPASGNTQAPRDNIQKKPLLQRMLGRMFGK
jgi:superfamily II DNA/RNA helicase